MSESLRPYGYSLPGSPVHGIFQVTMPSFKETSQPRDRTHITLHLLYWHVGSSPLAPSGKPLIKWGLGVTIDLTNEEMGTKKTAFFDIFLIYSVNSEDARDEDNHCRL